VFEISYFSAFIAGILSFISPCILPLLPMYLAFFAKNEKKHRFSHLLNIIAFVIGFGIIFIAMGLSSALLINQFIQFKFYLRIIGAIIMIVMGLYILGLIKIKALSTERRFHPVFQKSSWVIYCLVGMAFAAGWTPCIGPILASILFLAGMQGDVSTSILLLLFYTLGLAIPFLLIGIFEQWAMNFLKKSRNILFLLYKVAGIILIIMAFIMLFKGY